jgi:glutathione S-transferase
MTAPLDTEQAPLRLLTIPISHYCEKARWALDRAGLRYREERHVQGIHRIAARRAGAGPTVPVLVTPQGSIGESQEILAWADEQLAPELRLFPSEAAAHAEVDHLCRRLDEHLGPSGRRLMYVHMFTERKLALAYNNQGAPALEDRVLRLCWSPLKRFVARELGIVAGIESRDEAAVFRELDHVASLLCDGRPYLLGERFSAADLTFAARSAPITLPPGYGVPLPKPVELPPVFARIVEQAREHPAGRYALELYAKHRRTVPEQTQASTVPSR